MVEVMAENYHNIWAKKKKSDLGSRGECLLKFFKNAYNTSQTNRERIYEYVWVD